MKQELKKALKGGLCRVLPHPDIQVEFGHLYQPGGIHVSDNRNYVLLNDFWLELQVVLGC